MIDEKKLIEELKTVNETLKSEEIPKGNVHEFRRGFSYAMRIVESQQKVGKWIPCSERLPEKHVDVLVDFGDENPIIAWYSSVNDTWKNSITDHVIHIDAVAWMPLPEPYKGE